MEEAVKRELARLPALGERRKTRMEEIQAKRKAADAETIQHRQERKRKSKIAAASRKKNRIMKADEVKAGGEKPGYQTFLALCNWMAVARIEGDLFYNKGNQSAGRRSRTAFDQIAKLKVLWRKEVLG
jgi:hypothetical protein